MKRILISGATGFIGTTLVRHLAAQGHTPIRLTRSPKEPTDIAWDPAKGELADSALDGVDVVYNLAGESIGARRWSDEQKRRIIDSRVNATTLLRGAIEARADKPEAFVSASAIGFYGDRGDEVLTETSHAGEGFLPEVCRQWEAAAATDATRSVSVRTGLVMDKRGGALQRMLTPARLGLAGPIGNGQSWWSWITLNDMVRIYAHVGLNSQMAGAVNASGPNPVRNKEFMKALGRALHRPAVLPLPRFAIKAALGEMGDHLLFDSDRVLPERLTGDGFAFEDAELDPALSRVL